MTSVRILAFDTATAHCAASLSVDGKATTRIDPMAKGQAEHLLPMLEEMLADAGLDWPDLSAIAVGIGPGNFTGIRISVSAARGIALALGKPAIGVSGLETVAYGISDAVACLPAPRGQAYVQSFIPHGDVAPRLFDPADPNTWPKLSGRVTPNFCGPAAEMVANAMGNSASSPKIHVDMPPVERILRIAADRLGDEHIERPVPLYIKPPDAVPMARSVAAP